MTRYIALTLFLVLLLSGCGKTNLPFNNCRCERGLENRNLIRFEVEGEEEKMQDFMAALQQQFGTSRISFLHYRQEKYEDYFRPEDHALNPDHLYSPFGVQKIMVWDSLCRSDWFPDTLQMSIQVQEHRLGKRPIDPYACRVEMRLRNSRQRDLLENCRKARHVQKSMQQLVEQYIGAPHDTTPDPDFPAKVQDWQTRKTAFSQRVQGVLDTTCYPAVSYLPGSNSFRLQLCEIEGMTDTLVAAVKVLSVAGDPLPYRMFDIITDSLKWEVKILDGISGYRIYFEEIEEVGSILFLFRDGREVIFYEKGDFTRFPYPFKPRYSPDRQRRRQEEQLHEQFKPKEKVVS